MRRLLRLVIGLSLLLSSCAPAEPPSPHIFVFLVDTVRVDHLGCYGYERPTSPNLDAFAADALVFEQAYSPSPWTRPAITSLFTGLPPQLHGVRGRDGWLAPQAQTWAEGLSARGYHAGAWFTNANLESHFGLGQGFAEYSYEERKGRPYMDGPGMIDRWRARLDEQPVDTPLMHYLHLMDPHQPYLAEREYRRPFVRLPVNWQEWFDGSEEQGERIRHYVNTYDSEILQSDAAFGEFLDELRKRGWYEDSWIVFLSDHGEEFNEHGHHGHGQGLWEHLLRVPLVVRPPGGLGGRIASRLEELVSAPVPIHAVADMIGGRAPAGLGRANLLALGVTAPEAWIPTPENLAPPLRRSSFSLDGRAGMMVSRGNDKLVWNENPTPGWRASDLGEDPDERGDSGQRTPELIAELEALALSGWRGIRLEYSGADTLSLELRSKPPEALREVRVPPGEMPPVFRLGQNPATRQLIWSATPGQWLVLRVESDEPLRWRRPGGEWAVLNYAALASLRLDASPCGPAGEPSGAERDAIDPALEEKLRALGYLN